MKNDNYDNFYNSEGIWEEKASNNQEKVANDIINLIPEDIESILDVGCGNGVITNQLPEDKYVCGADISKEALKYIKRDKKVASIDDLPFKDNEFDLVLTSDTVEHLPIDVFNKGLNEIQRVAKKYLMIVTPYKEELDFAKTKCIHCGCRFHVNWHVHSLDINKIMKKIDCNKFELFNIAFTGEEWPYYGSGLEEIDRIIKNRYPTWDKAICPMCGITQTSNSDDNRTSHEVISDLEFKCFQDNIDDFIINRPTRNEMILLFKNRNYTSNDYENKLTNDSYLYIETVEQNQDNDTPKIKQVKKGFYDIKVGSKIQERNNTKQYTTSSYILYNENINWGDIEVVDNRLVRRYLDKNTEFNHAVFVIPKFTSDSFNITISYKDCSDIPLTLQVYDKNLSYFPIGEFEHKNDKVWKTSTFKIPSEIKCLEEGFMFDLVCNDNSKKPLYFIDKITVNNSKIYEEDLELDYVAKKNHIKKHYYNLTKEDLKSNRISLLIDKCKTNIKEIGLNINETNIILNQYRSYGNTIEITLEPWLLSDDYFKQNLNIESGQSIKKPDSSSYMLDMLDDKLNKNMLKTLKAKITNIQTESNNIEKTILNLENSIIESVESIIQNKIQDINNVKDNYERQISKIEKDISKYEKQLQKEKYENKNLEDKLNKFIKEIDELKSSNKQLSDSIIKKDELIDSLENIIDKLNNRTILDYLFKKGDN